MTTEPLHPDQVQIPFAESEFLNTSFRIKMNNSSGILFYFETVDLGPDEQGISQLSLETKNRLIETKDFKIESVTSDSDKIELEKILGSDPDIETTSALKNEADLEIEKILYNLYSGLGEKSNKALMTRWQSFLQRKFGLEFPIYVSPKINVVNKILYFSMIVASRSKLGSADFVIVSPSVGLYIMDDPRFQYMDDKKIHHQKHYTISCVGIISDRIKVFINPNIDFNDLSFVIGRTTKESETGVFMGEYNRRFIRSDGWLSPDFSSQTRFSLINKLAIDAVSKDSYKNYYKSKFVFGKKPLWRRLLML
jgi:hypothetical protein